MSDVGEMLRAKYGRPVRVADRGTYVLAWRHASEESARAFAEANGDEGSAICEDGVWLSVVDISARVAAADAAYRKGLRTWSWPD